MFKRHLNWTLFVGGYFVSSILGAVGLIVGSIIYVSSGYHSPVLLIGGLSLIFMLAPYALISIWHLKNKALSYWILIWPLLAASTVVFLYLIGLIPATVRTVEQYGMDLGNVRALVDISLELGLILLAGLVPQFILKNRTRVPEVMVQCPEHENHMAFHTCTDCKRPVCSLCTETIGDSSFCLSCFETKHLTAVGLNWFQRHLNWTFGSVAIIPVAIVVFLLHRALLWAVWPIYFVAIIFLVAAIWIIRRKARSLWFIMLAIWPFAAGFGVYTWEMHDIEYLKNSSDTQYLYYAYLRAVWFLFSADIIVVGTIISAIVLMALHNRQYISKVIADQGKHVKKWYRITAQAQPMIQQEQIAMVRCASQ